MIVLSRSSNCPRYFVPATISERSSARMRLSARKDGTSPSATFWARPSTIAVFPTPGSPINTGLFFVRRDRTWMTRLISASRPMTGSSFVSLAILVRSMPYFSSALKVSSGSGLVTRALPRIWPNASSSASAVTPAPASTVLASPPSAARPTSRCSVEMYSSPSCFALSDAVLIVRSSARDISGALVVVPRICGPRARRSSACLTISAGSVPTAWSSCPARPSTCSASATSRCSASICGLPSAAARCRAVDKAS